MKSRVFKFSNLKKILSFFKEDKLILSFHIVLCLISSGLILTASFFTGKVIDILFSIKDMTTEKLLEITWAVLITISLYFGFWLISSKIWIWTTKLSHRSGSRIRYAVFTKILNVPISYIDQSKIGELISRATNDVDIMISNMAQIVAGVFISPPLIISCFIINIIFSPLLSVVAFFLSLLTILITGLLAKKGAPDFKKMQDKIGELNSLSKEFISNRMATYVFGRQDLIKDKYSKVNDVHMNSSFKAEYKMSLIYPILDILENIVYGLLLIVGTIFILKNIPSGSFLTFNLGMLSTFVLLNRIALGEIGNISRLGTMYEKLFVCARRIVEILDEANDVDNGTLTLKNIKGDIEFKDVNFSYNSSKQTLKNINFNIKKGQVVGIVGPTGSGKSTIVNLLMRFYEIDSGKITIDGIDIKNIKKDELRQHISIVLQETNLFSESIYTNISYGGNPNEFNKEKVHDAAKHIGSEHFINVLPNCYDTVLDDNVPISQGESQMLALTRAYYSPTSIMVLDEATSSIDSKTELEIQNGIVKLMEDKTALIIAHRLSTIKNADLIIVLQNGEIFEQGNHEQLMKLNGFYAQMYKSGSNMSEDE